MILCKILSVVADSSIQCHNNRYCTYISLLLNVVLLCVMLIIISIELLPLIVQYIDPIPFVGNWNKCVLCISGNLFITDTQYNMFK